MGKKKVTFADIAEYTHFSKTTISRYFNDPDSLTLENQKIIADALIALDYKENKVARVLANGRTEMVGVLVPNMQLDFFAHLLNELLTTYEEYGYKFLVFPANDRPDTERKYLEELLAYNIEGLIVLSHHMTSQELASFGIPVVAIEREAEAVCSVSTDNEGGARLAAQKLLDCGCDVLFHINSDVDPKIPAAGRIRGFRDVCEAQGVEHEVILQDWGSNFQEYFEHLSPVFDDIDERFAGKKKGVFLSNDTLASAFLHLIFRRYGKLPDDYAIIGFDGSPVSSDSLIPFTTVAQDVGDLARSAMDLLVLQMDEQKKRHPKPMEAPVHKLIPARLIERDTTK